MGAYPQGVPPWQEGIDRLLAKIPRLVSTGDITVNDARVIDHLAVLLAFQPEEAPMSSSTVTVITPHGERRFPGARCEEDEEHVLTVYSNPTVHEGPQVLARFAFGTGWVGYYSRAATDGEEDHVITEGTLAS